MNYTWHTFNNYGIIISEFSDEQLSEIKKEISDIRLDFDNFKNQKHNSNLAGNISKEYSLVKSHNSLESLVVQLALCYDKEFKYLNSFDHLDIELPLCLKTTWVNFQEKYEFNPAHLHDGLLSFALYINVPYSYDDEKLVSPGHSSNYDSSGLIEFLYSDAVCGVSSFRFPIDKKMENKIIMFPSKMRHIVYPFFSSDDYRISVSGNIKYKISDHLKK